jgi:hypothetical protein
METAKLRLGLKIVPLSPSQKKGNTKIAATRCAEKGATLPQRNAFFGWTASRMALKYSEAANRKWLAA